MALTNIEFTIVLEGTSTITSGSDAVIVATEEQARTFSVVLPSGYESHTCYARITNTAGNTYLVECVDNEFQLNADQLLKGILEIQFELSDGTSRFVDNTVFELTIEGALRQVDSTSDTDIILTISNHIADTDLHLPDPTGNGGKILVVDNVTGEANWSTPTLDTSVSWGNIDGTLSDQTDLQTVLDSKATSTHNHNDDYYTESEVDLLLASKSDTTHTHTESDITDLGIYLIDAPSDGTQYARQDGAWTEVTASATTSWGAITGTLSNQTDLQTALDGKVDETTTINGEPLTSNVTLTSDDITEGATNLYASGNEFDKVVDTMDDITDGTTYVKTQNDFTDAEKTKLAGLSEGTLDGSADEVITGNWTFSGNADIYSNQLTSNASTSTQYLRLARVRVEGTTVYSRSKLNLNVVHTGTFIKFGTVQIYVYKISGDSSLHATSNITVINNSETAFNFSDGDVVYQNWIPSTGNIGFTDIYIKVDEYAKIHSTLDFGMFENGGSVTIDPDSGTRITSIPNSGSGLLIENISCTSEASVNADIRTSSAELLIDQNDGAYLKLWTGTQTEYDGLGSYDSDTVYIIT